MSKDLNKTCFAVAGELVNRPIGGSKAAKFAEVEGLKMNAASKALSDKLTESGLKGDAYRREVVKAFKNP